MKIFINYADDEETELDAVIEALRDTMTNFNIKRLNDRNNSHSDGKHKAYLVHNFRHPEI